MSDLMSTRRAWPSRLRRCSPAAVRARGARPAKSSRGDGEGTADFRTPERSARRLPGPASGAGGDTFHSRHVRACADCCSRETWPLPKRSSGANGAVRILRRLSKSQPSMAIVSCGPSRASRPRVSPTGWRIVYAPIRAREAAATFRRITTSATHFYRLWLDPQMFYSSGLYRSGDETLQAGAAEKGRSRSRTPRREKWRERARNRLRLGRSRRGHGAWRRRADHWTDAFKRTARPCARCRRVARLSVASRSPARGLPRHQRSVRSHRFNRDDRSGRTRILADLFCDAARPSCRGRPRRSCKRSPSKIAASKNIRPHRISFNATSSPAARCPVRARLRKKRNALDFAWKPSRLSATAMRAPSSSGVAAFLRIGARSKRWASTRPSESFGTTTFAIARAASARARSTSVSTSSLMLADHGGPHDAQSFLESDPIARLLRGDRRIDDDGRKRVHRWTFSDPGQRGDGNARVRIAPCGERALRHQHLDTRRVWRRTYRGPPDHESVGRRLVHVGNSI